MSTSHFERRTIQVGYLGVGVAFLSLLAASAAAYLVYQQFKEMSAQTGILDRGAKQARIDSTASGVTTTKQFDLMQSQIKVLQDQAESMERANNASARQFREGQRPWIGISEVTFANPQFFYPGPATQIEMSIDVSYALKNVGISAATKVYPEFFIVITDRPGFPTTMSPCPSPVQNGRFEFPRNTFFLISGDKIPVTETVMTNPERGGQIKSIWSIWMQACLTYQDRFGNVYQTKSIYHSLTRDDSVPIVAVPGHDFSYKPIIGWILWSAEAN